MLYKLQVYTFSSLSIYVAEGKTKYEFNSTKSSPNSFHPWVPC